MEQTEQEMTDTEYRHQAVALKLADELSKAKEKAKTEQAEAAAQYEAVTLKMAEELNRAKAKATQLEGVVKGSGGDTASAAGLPAKTHAAGEGGPGARVIPSEWSGLPAGGGNSLAEKGAGHWMETEVGSTGEEQVEGQGPLGFTRPASYWSASGGTDAPQGRQEEGSGHHPAETGHRRPRDDVVGRRRCRRGRLQQRMPRVSA